MLDKGGKIKIEVIIMLSEEERELLIKTYEKTHDVKLTVEIFGVNVRTVYERIRDYQERGTTELRTHQRGRKSLITPEDEERIKELIRKNNDITIHEINETLKLNVNDETIRQHVIKMGFRYKKKSIYAAEGGRSRCNSEEK